MKEYYKKIRILMIEKNVKWKELFEKQEKYRSEYGLRYGLKHNNEQAYNECRDILTNFF